MWAAPKGRAYSIWRKAQAAAKKKGLGFDLTPEFLRMLIEPGVCMVTGIPFVYEKGEGRNWRRPFAPSIDRIDPTKGYTKNNVQLVVWAYNAAKGTWTHEQVMTMAKALVKTESREAVA